MAKIEKKTFEEIYEEIEIAVEKLESNDQPIGKSIELYEETMEKIKLAQKKLAELKGRIEEISG